VESKENFSLIFLKNIRSLLGKYLYLSSSLTRILLWIFYQYSVYFNNRYSNWI